MRSNRHPVSRRAQRDATYWSNFDSNIDSGSGYSGRSRSYSTTGVSTSLAGGGTGVTLRLSSGGPVGLDFNPRTGRVELSYRY